MKFLVEYDWPGNIRELKNVIERLIVLTENDMITPHDIAQAIPGLYGCEHIDERFEDGECATLQEIEKKHITNMLKLTGGHKGRASQMLGISPRTLYAKLKKYNIDFNGIR